MESEKTKFWAKQEENGNELICQDSIAVNDSGVDISFDPINFCRVYQQIISACSKKPKGHRARKECFLQGYTR